MGSYARATLRATICVLAAGLVSCVPVISNGVVQLPCCSSATVSIVRIDTGSAPWKVKVPGATSSQPVASAPPHGAWAAVNSATWVMPPGTTYIHPVGTYSYTIPFEIPTCNTGRHVTVSGRFAADNSASAFLDTPAGIAATPFASQATATHGFQAAHITPFSITNVSGQPGIYVLRFEVKNVGTSYSDTGLAVSGIIATHCAGAIS